MTIREPGVRAHRPTLVALVAALVLAVAAPVLPTGLGGPATVRGAAPDLTLVTHAVYTVRPEEGRIAVAVAIEARNHTSETRTRRYFFDHAYLAVQPGAANPHLSGPRGARVRVAGRTRQSTLLRLDFGTRIYSGRSAALRLTFDLPGSGKAASPQVRVGSSFVTVPVWAYASNGARGSTVTVRFPGGWDVAVESGELTRSDDGPDGGGVGLQSGPISDPLDFFAFVTAQRPAVYGDRPVTVTVGDQRVELVLQAWKDDPAWSKRMERLFAKALPVLHEDIGLPWPMAEPLAIRESVSRDADAYAGLFDPAERRMEVAYWADHGVIVHQAAHAWFNGAMLADRWANEGFATYYGLRAAEQLGEAAKPPVMTDEAEAAAAPLDTWAGSTGARTPADTYAYAASYRLAAAIAEQVGHGVLTAVWADAAAGTGAYQPPAAGPDAAPATRERVSGPPDWRGLLDLLEDRSGMDLVPRWRATVVTPGEAALLDARADARRAYRRTLALAGDWQLPRAIRDALRAWDFGAAEALMADARTVLAQRNAGAELAAREGVSLPGVMRALFEGGSLAEASARAEAERNAILAIRQAADAVSVASDLLTRIGMLGEHPEQDVAQAREALAAGDLDAALASADRANRAWTSAWQEGRRRALLALAALVAMVVLLAAVVSSARRSRRSTPRSPRPSAPSPPGDGIAPA